MSKKTWIILGVIVLIIIIIIVIVYFYNKKKNKVEQKNIEEPENIAVEVDEAEVNISKGEPIFVID